MHVWFLCVLTRVSVCDSLSICVTGCVYVRVSTCVYVGVSVCVAQVFQYQISPGRVHFHSVVTGQNCLVCCAASQSGWISGLAIVSETCYLLAQDRSDLNVNLVLVISGPVTSG